MEAHQLPKMSVEEYIHHEKEAGQKYEFHDGLICALAGGSLNHGLLIGNIYAELRNGLKRKGSNCKAITSEVKLYIKNENKFVYPDSMIVCGEIEKAEPHQEAVTNPVLIVEVLSKSTVEYDKGDKFYYYRQIPTLKEYVLIEQDRYVVEVYCKQGESDLWSISRYEGLETNIKLHSVSLEISMKDLYFDVVVL